MHPLLALALLLQSPPARELAPPPRSFPDAKPSEFVGYWEGTLVVGAAKIPLGFGFVLPEAGPLAATISSPAQGALFVPCDSAAVKGRTITVEMKSSLATFAGTLSGDGKSLAGEWRQGFGKLPLTLNRTDKPAAPARPQSPKPPFLYNSAEVTFENAAAKVTLAGTLTTPKTGPVRAAFICVSGSGPQDRDETLFAHKPFAVIADALTRRGYAVLRYDDRGVGKSTGDHGAGTSVDFASDALAAVRFLAKQPGIDPKRVGILGHSEGGLIGPMVAAKHPEEVAFLVMLAGPSLSGAAVLRAQQIGAYEQGGVKPEVAAKVAPLADELVSALKPGLSRGEARKALKVAATAFADSLAGEERKALALTPAVIDAIAERVSSPWMRYFVLHDPAPDLKATTCPVLALFGERDVQVEPKSHAAKLKELAPGAAVEIRAGLNHLFQPCKTGAVAEYAAIETTFEPATLARIAAWLDSTFPAAKPGAP